jgi:hypothetical protein
VDDVLRALVKAEDAAAGASPRDVAWPAAQAWTAYERRRAIDVAASAVAVVALLAVGLIGIGAAVFAARSLAVRSFFFDSQAITVFVTLVLFAVLAFAVCFFLQGAPRRARAAAARRRRNAGVPPRSADFPAGDPPATAGTGSPASDGRAAGVLRGSFLVGASVLCFAALFAARTETWLAVVYPLAGVFALVAAWRFFSGSIQGRLMADWSLHPPGRGRRVRVQVAVEPGGSVVQELRFALRAVRSGKAPFFVPEGVRQFRPVAPAPDACGPEEWVAVEFLLPADAPETDLSAPRTLHWELVGRGRGAWGEADLCVAVPVYFDEEPAHLRPGASPSGSV